MSGHDLLTMALSALSLGLSGLNLRRIRQSERELEAMERRLIAMALRGRKPMLGLVGTMGPDTSAGAPPREGGR